MHHVCVLFHEVRSFNAWPHTGLSREIALQLEVRSHCIAQVTVHVDCICTFLQFALQEVIASCRAAADKDPFCSETQSIGYNIH